MTIQDRAERNVRLALRDAVEYCKDQYAVAYARRALDNGMRGEELRGQVLYVLSNTNHWRGELARNAKIVLREFSRWAQ